MKTKRRKTFRDRAEIKKKLLRCEISQVTAEILAQRFQSTQEALSFHKEYKSNSRSIRKSLHEREVSSSTIKFCTDRLLPLDEAIKELFPQQDSVSSPTPVPLVDIHSTSSIRQESNINSLSPHSVDIPGNIPRNPEGIPEVGSQFSPSPINIPQTPVRSNDEELVIRSSFRIEEVSAFSIQGSNGSSQSTRRIQSAEVYEDLESLPQSVELEDLRRSDSSVSPQIHSWNSEWPDPISDNLHSIGANDEEEYKNSWKGFMDILHSAEFIEGIIQSLNPILFKETTRIICDVCMICSENFAIKEEIIILPCVHPFHSGCIRKLLKTSELCPICRANFVQFA